MNDKYTAEQVFLRSEDVKYSVDIDFRLTPACAADICKMLRNYATLLRERESVKAQVFVPPSNCRQRLKREGRPYPRSSCQACGKWCPRNQDCEVLLDAAAINPILASARVPDETKDAQRYRLIRSGKSELPLPLGAEALDIYLDMKLKTAPKPEKE